MEGPLDEALWEFAARQHGVVSRAQLLYLGFTPSAISHRVERGRLHRLRRGVLTVGRPSIDQFGRGMAAVLAGGPDALLSHQSAAELWEIRPRRSAPIEVTLTSAGKRRAGGITVHRRPMLGPRSAGRGTGSQ
jgi:hypothetical protein